MLQKLIDDIKKCGPNSTLEYNVKIGAQLAIYLAGLQQLEKELINLHQVASKSLVEGNLDETERGHRLGVIEVCEAVMKIF